VKLWIVVSEDFFARSSVDDSVASVRLFHNEADARAVAQEWAGAFGLEPAEGNDRLWWDPHEGAVVVWLGEVGVE
jgi:hypothetical protein